ncbi:hypothetical protein ACN42_g10008 [Penicillium freii]|uniref:Uncharacterized protein n=1 Tax=Penicillium freii TaxID=48697 RepID=A0A117NL70_PENFR|nr:hypothetical protein ACN42_g10008 [Penicillium freii]
MLIESGVRRIWTLQSESPASTKTDDPGLNPCHLTEGVHNCWKGRQYTIQSMNYRIYSSIGRSIDLTPAIEKKQQQKKKKKKKKKKEKHTKK